MLHRLTAIVLVLLTLLGCAPQGQPGRELQVYVPVLPLAHVAEVLLADRGTAGALFEKGQDPHAISLSPSQVKALGHARVYFSAGLAFESALEARFRGQDHPRFVSLLSDVHAHDDHSDHEHHHDHDHEAHSDPHLWLSPRHLILAASIMRDTLVELDPEGTEAYSNAFQTFAMRVGDVAEESRRLLQPFEGRTFYIQHGALDYFAEFFGLEQAALEIHGREPTARQLTGLVEQARAEGVRVVFSQKGQGDRSAQVFANAIGADVVEVDAVAGDPVENIRSLAHQLARAFQLQVAP